MHELPWITIFGSRVRRFANDFHEWRSHEWKSLANRITSDPKIVIHGNKCIILFLIRYFISRTQNSAKKQSSIGDFAIVAKAVFADLLWRHHNWSVMSCECRLLALWRHIRRLFFCKRRLAQRPSSLVNNSREYRFLTTRYSRPSV